MDTPVITAAPKPIGKTHKTVKPAKMAGATPPRVHPAGAHQPDTNARMLQLIEAAEGMFLAKGYHAATMSEVARAAGMSKKTVYMLIDSKAELFAALLAHHQSLLNFPEPEPDWTVRDTLIANLVCLARFLLSPQQIAIIRLIMAEYTHSPDMGRVFHRNRVMKAKAKLECCLADIARSQSCADADTKEMAAMLFGMAIGEMHLGVLVGFRNVPTRQMVEKRVRHAVDIFLGGCMAA
ncbi:MAG: TetR/AcrR family transcriptional regulator [Acidocella sp.]|nr:TetR/AcrR family transcriptional regulator [Acidocella sp.]